MKSQPATSQEHNQQLNELIQKCVHCGFCNATCPSYHILGNELDSPRGRIYQIANMINGESDDPSIRRHLDSCLSCRNCESTCPSSVDYSTIFALGKQQAVTQYPYTRATKIKQSIVIAVLSHPTLSRVLFSSASLLRVLLPRSVRTRIPARDKPIPMIDNSQCTRTAILLQGCVQSAAQPNTNRALHNLCARMDIRLITISPAQCCGALAHHLNHQQQAIAKAKANIDACLTYVAEQQVEAIVMAASACVLELKEYPKLLADSPDYQDKLQVFSALVQDPSELLDQIATLGIDAQQATLAFHPPCTLQHGQKNHELAEKLLRDVGFQLMPIVDGHLCCGSAGTYSLFQPQVAKALREKKIDKLTSDNPDYLATANIGCQMFLQQAADHKIWHWLELVEQIANRQRPLY